MDIQRFGAAREVHEKLNTLLGDKRTFFDHKMQEEIKEEAVFIEGGERVKFVEELPKITSLDIVAWAYLKEEIVNTGESQEVKDLKEKYPALVGFVKYMDEFFERIEKAIKEAG